MKKVKIGVAGIDLLSKSFFVQNKLKELPQKEKFKIGQVAALCEVKPFVLRFWETEFSFLKPKGNKGSHRLYTIEDVKRLLVVKKLLHIDRYSIEGAKKSLNSDNLKTKGADSKGLVQELRTELSDFKSFLSSL